MRNVLIAATLLLSVLSCDAQKTCDFAIITGKIENCKVKELAVNKMFRKYQHFVKVSADGSFADIITNFGKYTAYEVDGNFGVDFYCENGNRIHITYDANDPKATLKITGNGSEASNYLFEKIGKRNALVEKGLTRNHIDVKLDEKAFRAELEKRKNVWLEFLKKNELGLSEEFIAQEKRALDYYYIGGLLNYTIEKNNIQLDDSFYLPKELSEELKIVGYSKRDNEDVIECARLMGFYLGAESMRLERERSG